MARQHIDVRVRSKASPTTIYGYLVDGESWPRWSPIGSFTLQQPGPTEREGVGAIRIFRTGRVTSCERVIERVPDRRFSYELLSGLPLRGYRADVDLTPTPDGTEIRWHSSFDAKVPGTGWFYRRVLTRFIRHTAEGLAARGDASAVPS
ncbi:SRPBCC family protein [Micromonospora sp. NPDC049559]|uniref:SRPBCC family protein n=1 Tax=Micromonospora sp. NPDC049559 TaxID=3155923 RepID=UPI0034171BFA